MTDSLNDWISVKKMLPKPFQDVFVKIHPSWYLDVPSIGRIQVDSHDSDKWRRLCKQAITHWMPIEWSDL